MRYVFVFIVFVVLVLLCSDRLGHKAKVQPAQSVQTWPETDNPVMENVTIEYWEKGHKTAVLHSKILEIVNGTRRIKK